MIEKLAQAGGGGGGEECTLAHPPPFTIFTIMYKVAVYAPAEQADTLTPYFMSIPMYAVERTFAWAAALVHKDTEY